VEQSYTEGLEIFSTPYSAVLPSNVTTKMKSCFTSEENVM